MAAPLLSRSLVCGERVRVGRKSPLELPINLPYLSGLHCEVDVRACPSGCGFSCGVVDHSLNGTWWLQASKGGDAKKNAVRLKKGERQEMECGDQILLLSPYHKHCPEWRFVLERGEREGEFVFRQLPPTDCSPHAEGVKRATEEAEISPTKTPRLDDTNATDCMGGTSSHPHTLTSPEATVHKVAEHISTPSPIDKPAEHSVKPAEHSVKPAEHSLKPTEPSLLSTSSHKLTVVDLTASPKHSSTPSGTHKHTSHEVVDLTASPLIVSPKLTAHGSSSSPAHKPADIETMELEHCPKCLELFPVDQLPSHSDLCTQTAPVCQEACPVCGKSFPVMYLVPHASSCRGGNKGSDVDSSKVETDSARKPALEAYEGSTSHVTSVGSAAVSEATAAPAMHTSTENESTPTEQEHCQHCLEVFPLSELVAHSLSCPYRKESQESGACLSGGEDVERCMHCFKDFPLSRIVNHSRMCKGDMMGPRGRFTAFLPSVHDMDPMALSVLNETQMAAVEYVMKRSKVESESVYSDLKKRVLSLGYTEKDLKTTLQWVRRDAPIIVHLNLDRALRFLVKDTHYRNLFETGTGGGGTDKKARESWEDRIFNKLYASSPAIDRVKYGVLNIVGDPRGVEACRGYGDSFLQLKKVRLRTTFASADTANSDVQLSCCEYYGNVLNRYSLNELQAILEVATRKQPFLRSNIITHYKEVQIHGPLCLSENVDCIVVNDRHTHCKATRDLLDRFVEMNKCNLVWMEPAEQVGYPEPTTTRRKKRKRHSHHGYDDSYHGYDYDYHGYDDEYDYDGYDEY